MKRGITVKSKSSTAVSGAARPFGAIDKWAYAMGDLGCNMSFALNSYLMLFYTQYIGLSLTTWGVIILFLKIWDGINDPIMGGLMDSIKPGKRGKFKTYIFYGSFVLLVSGAMCFLPIPSAPYWVKVLVCVLGYLVWDMSYTVVNVPYGAMSAAITAKPTERAQLSTYRSIGAGIANVITMLLLPVLIYNERDELLGNRMFIIALVMGVMGFIAFQILLKGTTERITVSAENKPREKYNYFKAIGGFFKNRAAVGCTLAAIAQLVSLAGMQNANQILFQSYFKMAKLSGLTTIMAYLPMVIFIPLVKPLVKRFGKKEASAYPLILGIISSLLMTVLPITADTKGVVVWIILLMLYGLSTGVFLLVCWAMVSDSIDYHEFRTGRREEGTIYATYSLGRKLAQGFGASVISFLLEAVGYIPTLGPDQTLDVALNIKQLCGLIQFVGALIMFISLAVIYNLDKKTVSKMEQSLGRSNLDVVGEASGDD